MYRRRRNTFGCLGCIIGLIAAPFMILHMGWQIMMNAGQRMRSGR